MDDLWRTDSYLLAVSVNRATALDELDEPEGLFADIDQRLLQVCIRFLWTVENIEYNLDDPYLYALLRVSYAQGYRDALSEPEPGSLYLKHGQHPPTREGEG